MKKIVVIGGGISGLATAHFIAAEAEKASRPVDLVLLECSSRVGGKIESVRENGYLCESGPNGFLNSRLEVMALCAAAGVEHRLLTSNDAARKRYVYTKGALQLVPMSPPGFLGSKILSTRGKLRILREPWTKPAQAGIDETVASFGERHLGREAVDQLIGPFVTGVFAGDPHDMSVASTLPVMIQLEKEGSGSLIKAMLRRRKAKKAAGIKNGGGPKSEGLVGASGKMTSFDNGMAVLTGALAAGLGSVIRTGQRVSSITNSKSGSAPWRVWVEGAGEPYEADAVICAAPSYSASTMLQEIDESLAAQLARIPYVAVNVVNIGLPLAEVPGGLDGFGFLIPQHEKRRILGAVWTSSLFPDHAPEGQASIRVMVGGARGAAHAALDDDQTLQMAREEISELMGISAEPDFVKIVRWEHAIPQYRPGHGQILSSIDQRLENHGGLLLTGNAYRGVSLPDCIRASAATAAKAAEILG